MLGSRGFFPIVTIFLVLVLVFFCGIAFGVYRFQQSSVYIKQGNEALKGGNTDLAKELYDKARDVFPYRPLVSQSFEAFNLFTNSDIQYGESNNLLFLATPSPSASVTPSPSASPTSAPSSQINIPEALVPPKEIKIPILMYHHIRINPRPNDPVWTSLNVTPRQLEDQFQYFTTHNYHSITLDDLSDVLLGKIQLPQKPIILTFDDGYSSFYDNAYPLIKKYNMKAIDFVITGVIGAGAYLNWNQIKEMNQSPLISFGAHTRHHPSLVFLSAKLAEDEIKGSKIDLERQLKKPVSWFAYPYGNYNDRAIQLVKDAGFLGAVSTIYGAVQTKDKLFLLPRIMVDGRYTTDTLIKRMQ